MSYWISDHWKYYGNILKTCQMHENWAKPIFCPIDKKWFFFHFNGVSENILVCEKFSSKSKCYLMFMVYHAVISFFCDIFVTSHFVCLNWVLVALIPMMYSRFYIVSPPLQGQPQSGMWHVITDYSTCRSGLVSYHCTNTHTAGQTPGSDHLQKQTPHLSRQ